MASLYIIGNGFDLHHELDTHYRSFGLFLQKHYDDIYDQLLEYFGLPDITEDDERPNPLWNQFERSLARLDVNLVYDAYSGSLATPGAPDFRDRDWNTFAIDMEMVVDRLTTNLIKAFCAFITKLDYNSIPATKRLSLNTAALYLSFNYTDTLEKYYSIPSNQIIYLHGNASHNDDIILGHGLDPNSFKEPAPEPPKGLNAEELERWQEDMNDQFDYSLELGKTALQQYFSSSYKNTQAVIHHHIDFFHRINT